MMFPNAGAWTDILRFFTKGPAAASEKYFFREITGDRCGDATQLTNIFSEYAANISGTGTTLNLRLLVYVEGSNEEWGIDDLRLFSSGTLPVRLIDFSGIKEANGNWLHWSTASENNNGYFEVQRSPGGQCH